MAGAYDKLKQAVVDALMKKRDAEVTKGMSNTSGEYTKATTPAGQDRSIEKEDNTARRKQIDSAIEDAEK